MWIAEYWIDNQIFCMTRLDSPLYWRIYICRHMFRPRRICHCDRNWLWWLGWKVHLSHSTVSLSYRECSTIAPYHLMTHWESICHPVEKIHRETLVVQIKWEHKDMFISRMYSKVHNNDVINRYEQKLILTRLLRKYFANKWHCIVACDSAVSCHFSQCCLIRMI